MNKQLLHRFFTLQALGVTTIVLLTVMVIVLICSFVTIHRSQPLENLYVEKLPTVDLAHDNTFKFAGTYDRNITCNLYNFDVHLTDIGTNNIITLGPDHLSKKPKSNRSPGKNIPIEFHLTIPATIYPGTWKTEFTGRYICRLGIFVDQKFQAVTIEPFVIIDSSANPTAVTILPSK